MTDEIFNEIAYPSGEMDLKRRIAGEVFRIYEDFENQPPDDDLVELIEAAFAHIQTSQIDKIRAGRPIDVTAEVRNFLAESAKGA